MTTAAVRFTYADYLNLPEESRYEILDGDLLMSPSPNASHQRIVKKLARIFGRLLEDASLGEIFVAPFDVVLSDTNVVQPDILFISKERASIVKERAVFGAPDLAVEVLSPATAERDRTVKAKLYARAGVRELWLVDPGSKTIEVLQSGAAGFERKGLAKAGETAQSATLPALRVRLADVF
jgi:Uma2 family endonuclease